MWGLSSLTRDHTLVAKWENQKFNVVIEYVYENGSTAADTVEREVEYGAAYSVISPTITGYTPDIAEVSGTMAGSHIKYIVTYISDTHELRIYYRYADDVEDIALQGQLIAEIVPNPYVAVLKPGDKFGGSDAGVVSLQRQHTRQPQVREELCHDGGDRGGLPHSKHT